MYSILIQDLIPVACATGYSVAFDTPALAETERGVDLNTAHGFLYDTF